MRKCQCFYKIKKTLENDTHDHYNCSGKGGTLKHSIIQHKQMISIHLRKSFREWKKPKKT
jgi:hypothetical protein